jgi:hypothetical protein
MTGRNSAVSSASPPKPPSISSRNAPHPTTRKRPRETLRSRLHPAQHVSFVVAVDQDREFALLVGLKALIGVATLLEAAKDMLSRIARRDDRLAERADGSIIGNIERLRTQKLKAARNRGAVIGRGFPIMRLHLFEDEAGQILPCTNKTFSTSASSEGKSAPARPSGRKA